MLFQVVCLFDIAVGFFHDWRYFENWMHLKLALARFRPKRLGCYTGIPMMASSAQKDSGRYPSQNTDTIPT
jgi:hypothetical protein